MVVHCCGVSSAEQFQTGVVGQDGGGGGGGEGTVTLTYTIVGGAMVQLLDRGTHAVTFHAQSPLLVDAQVETFFNSEQLNEPRDVVVMVVLVLGRGTQRFPLPHKHN